MVDGRVRGGTRGVGRREIARVVVVVVQTRTFHTDERDSSGARVGV